MGRTIDLLIGRRGLRRLETLLFWMANQRLRFEPQRFGDYLVLRVLNASPGDAHALLEILGWGFAFEIPGRPDDTAFVHFGIGGRITSYPLTPTTAKHAARLFQSFTTWEVGPPAPREVALALGRSA